MKTEFVMQYLPRKMRAMGIGDNYLLTYKDVTVKASGTVRIKASNMFFFFVEGFTDRVRITSESGVYDLTNETLNEQMHEHTGEIKIENRDDRVILHLEFIVAIIKNKKIKNHEK